MLEITQDRMTLHLTGICLFVYHHK